MPDQTAPDPAPWTEEMEARFRERYPRIMDKHGDRNLARDRYMQVCYEALKILIQDARSGQASPEACNQEPVQSCIREASTVDFGDGFVVVSITTIVTIADFPTKLPTDERRKRRRKSKRDWARRNRAKKREELRTAGKLRPPGRPKKSKGEGPAGLLSPR